MNKQYLSFVAHFAVAWFLCTSPVLAQIDVDVVAESVVRVRAYDNHKVVVEGSGFVVNEEGYVLTNAHLIEKAEALTVLSLKTGADWRGDGAVGAGHRHGGHRVALSSVA